MAFSFKRIGSMLDDPENRRLEGLLSTAPAPAPAPASAPAPTLEPWMLESKTPMLSYQDLMQQQSQQEGGGTPYSLMPEKYGSWGNLGMDTSSFYTPYQHNGDSNGEGSFDHAGLDQWLQQNGLKMYEADQPGQIARWLEGSGGVLPNSLERVSTNEDAFWTAAQLASMVVGQGVNEWSAAGNGMNSAPSMIDPSRIDAYGMPASDGIKTLGTIPAGTGPVAPLETMGTVDPMAGVPSAPTVPPGPTTPSLLSPVSPPVDPLPMGPGPVEMPTVPPAVEIPSMLPPTVPEASYSNEGNNYPTPESTATSPVNVTPAPELSPLDKFTTWAKSNPTEAKLLFGAAGGLMGGSDGGSSGGYSYNGPMPTVSRDGWSPTATPKTGGGMLAPSSGGGGMLGGMNIKRGEPNSGLWRYLGLLGG